MQPPTPLNLSHLSSSNYGFNWVKSKEYCDSPKFLDSLEAHGASMCGLRNEQEDRFGFLNFDSPLGVTTACFVADGHGGTMIAQHLETHLLNYVQKRMSSAKNVSELPQIAEDVFVTAHNTVKMLAPFNDSGACLILAIKLPTQILLASAGDCRSLLVFKDGKNTCLTNEHKLTIASERARIEDAGLHIIANRVCGLLNVSRAIGDYEFSGSSEDLQKQGVTCIPECYTIVPSESMHGIVLMSDGVYDSLEMDKIAQMALTLPPESLCTSILKDALNQGSSDNMTAVFIPL